jgi:hypothetical protein
MLKNLGRDAKLSTMDFKPDDMNVTIHPAGHQVFYTSDDMSAASMQ